MKKNIRYIESSSDRKMSQKYDKMRRKKGNHTFCVMKYAYHLLVENVEIYVVFQKRQKRNEGGLTWCGLEYALYYIT